MDTNRRFGLAGVIVALAASAGLLVAPDLPAEMATHWNAAGEPDATLSKPIALGLMPGLTALLLGVLYVLPRVDPKGENIERFRATYDWFVVGLAATLSVVHVGIVAYNLGYRFPFVSLVLVVVACVLYAAGVVLERAEQNWVVGIRTPWTLESEAVWERTHEVGASLFKLTALAVLLGAIFPQYSTLLLVGPLVVTTVVLTIYPYLLYRRLEAE